MPSWARHARFPTACATPISSTCGRIRRIAGAASAGACSKTLRARSTGQHVYLFTDDAHAFYAACGFVARGTGLEKVIGKWLDNESRDAAPRRALGDE